MSVVCPMPLEAARELPGLNHLTVSWPQSSEIVLDSIIWLLSGSYERLSLAKKSFLYFRRKETSVYKVRRRSSLTSLKSSTLT